MRNHLELRAAETMIVETPLGQGASLGLTGDGLGAVRWNGGRGSQVFSHRGHVVLNGNMEGQG